jgi:hypothetical protein
MTDNRDYIVANGEFSELISNVVVLVTSEDGPTATTSTGG